MSLRVKLRQLLKAHPVITTASDVQKTIPVDLFGKRFGWVWESAEKLTPVSASVVNEEEIAVVQESGEKNWWHMTPCSENIKIYSSIQTLLKHRHMQPCGNASQFNRRGKSILENGVLYRPKGNCHWDGMQSGTLRRKLKPLLKKRLLNYSFQ